MLLRKLLVTALAVFALIGTGPVFAADSGSGGGHYHSQVNEYYSWLYRLLWSLAGHIHDAGCGHGSGAGDPNPGQVAAVPELDGTSAGLSLALLAGLVLVVREARKRRA